MTEKLFSSTGQDREVSAIRTFVDLVYARPFYPLRANAIAKVFRWPSFARAILSSRANGRFAVIDGQHRIAAARQVYGPDVMIPSVVHHNLTVKEEALFWSELNSGKKPRAHEILASDYTAGKQDAVELVNYVREVGLGVFGMDGKNSSNPLLFKPIASARLCQRQDWHDTKRTIRVMTDVWLGQPSSTNEYVFGGLYKFLHAYDTQINETRLRQVLERHTPQTLLSQSEPLIGALGRGHPDRATARIILSWYNSWLQGKGRLDPSKLGM